MMDYGKVTKRIPLMAWTTMENPHIKKKSGFLLGNFSCMVKHPHDSFVLPSQVQQVFYANADSIGPWRVVLHSKPRTKRFQVSDYGEFINTRVCVPSLEAEALVHPTSNILNRVGAITLFERDVELALAPLLRSNFGNISDED